MGLRSLFRRVTTNVGRIFEDTADIAEAVAPIALQLAAPGLAGAFSAANPAGGSQAVAQANLAQPGCPPAGFQGNRTPGANPITRAAISPGFDVNRLPARPLFGAEQTIRAQFPQVQFPQGLSLFEQQIFGAPVNPSFRPFTPSFRSGRPSLSQVGRPPVQDTALIQGRQQNFFGGFGF